MFLSNILNQTIIWFMQNSPFLSVFSIILLIVKATACCCCFIPKNINGIENSKQKEAECRSGRSYPSGPVNQTGWVELKCCKPPWLESFLQLMRVNQDQVQLWCVSWSYTKTNRTEQLFKIAVTLNWASSTQIRIINACMKHFWLLMWVNGGNHEFP